MRAKIAIAFFAALSVACLSYVLSGDYSSGDIYPEYSTLRTDRTGSSALYEALTRAGLTTSRNYIPLASAPIRDADVLLLNVSEQELTETWLKTLEALSKKNNRIVIALNPERFIMRAREKRSEKADLEKRWGVSVMETGDDGPHYFEATPQWKVFRSENGKPVIVEKQFGSGTIALLTNPDPFSNVALREDRDLPLLSWAAGEKNKIVFDESHLGSVQQGTIVGLALQLRLQGLIAVLLTCALLFIWQSSVPFPPGPTSSQAQDFTLIGAGTSEALPNLLARHIARARLMKTCVAEWRRDRGRKAGETKIARIENIAASNAPALRQWEDIRTILGEKESA